MRLRAFVTTLLSLLQRDGAPPDVAAPGTQPRFGSALPPVRLVNASPDALSVEWDAVPGASYALLADDWWGSTTDLSRPVYRGAAPSFTLTERVVPSAPVALVVVALDAGGAELGRSPAAAFTAPPRGACASQPDATVWRDNQDHVRADATACLEACALDGGECTEACVLKRDPFSDTCGACFASFYDCAEAHCTLSCAANPKGRACHSCTERECTAAARECTGMPAWAWA